MTRARKLPADKRVAAMAAKAKSQAALARRLNVTPAAISRSIRRACMEVEIPSWVHEYLRPGYARIAASKSEPQAAAWARAEKRRAEEIARDAPWVTEAGEERRTTPSPSVFERSIQRAGGKP